MILITPSIILYRVPFDWLSLPPVSQYRYINSVSLKNFKKEKENEREARMNNSRESGLRRVDNKSLG